MSLSLPTSSSQRFIGPYEIIRQIGLGTGGGLAGQAYLARDSRSAAQDGGQVVVKLSTYDSGAIYQVQTEARILAALRDAIKDAGISKWTDRNVPIPWLYEGPLELPNDRRVYLVEEYLADPFVPLPDLTRRGGLTPYNALELILDLARLLEIAHDAQIVHGDLNDRKIEHIFWDPWGRRLKVIDWGIADDPSVVERRHLPNNDIQGLGTLLHVALTGESRSRENSLSDWAERIVRVCLEQDPGSASLADPILALEEALRHHREPVRAAALRLRDAVAAPAGPSKTGQVQAAIDDLAQLDPYHLMLRDPDWLLTGQAAVAGAYEGFRRELGEMLDRFVDTREDQGRARQLAASLARRARDLDQMTVRARALERRLVGAFGIGLPNFVVMVDWVPLAQALEAMVSPSFALHAPAGPTSPPWTTFAQALGQLHLRNAADVLGEHPTLADADPVAAARRAAKLRMQLLSAWYRVHPLTDVEWHVDLARAWRQAAETSGAMSRATLERWQRLLGAAANACLALRQPGAPGDVAARWEELARIVDELDAESPERVSREAPLHAAQATLRAEQPRLRLIAEAWRGGQYPELGRAVDGLVEAVPELFTALGTWVSSAPPVAARQLAQRELLGHLTEATHERPGRPFDPDPILRNLEAVARLDPGAPWIGVVRAAVRTVADLTSSQDAALRTLGDDTLTNLAAAAEHRRPELAQVGDPEVLEAAIRQAAGLVSGPVDSFEESTYQQVAATLGPLRPAFDAALAATHARDGEGALRHGDWSRAAATFDRAAMRTRLVDEVRSRAYGATATAASELARAFAALLDGDAARMAASLAAVDQAGPGDRDAVRHIAATVGRLEPLQQHLAGLNRAIRASAPPGETRQYVGALSQGLDDPSIPGQVREGLQPILATFAEALRAGTRTPSLLQLGRESSVGERTEWQVLATVLAQQLSAPTDDETADGLPSASGVSGSARHMAQAVPIAPNRRRIVLLAAVGICLLSIVAGALTVSRFAPWSGGANASVTPTTVSSLSAGSVSGDGVTVLSPQVQAERDAPSIIAAARAKANPPEEEADPAISQLEELEGRLAPQSQHRQEILALKAKIWIDDANRRIEIAKQLNRPSVFDEARDRFEKARATGKTDERIVVDGLKRVEIARLWLAFESANGAGDFPGAYAALREIFNQDPQSKGPNGTVQEKIYNLQIDWATALKQQGSLDEAMKALDQAETFDPARNEARDLRQAWTPTPTPVPAAPQPQTQPRQQAPAQAAPPRNAAPQKPGISAPAAPAVPVAPQPPAPPPPALPPPRNRANEDSGGR